MSRTIGVDCCNMAQGGHGCGCARGAQAKIEAERIEKAREWRAAAVERRDHCRRELEDESNGEMPEPWWSAQHNTIDGMQDRINVIDALFPELAV